MSALFTFDGVVVVRGGRTVLDVDRLAIGADGATAIVGPSGSGKSTLLRLCNRLEVPSAGTVRYRGADLGGLDPRTHRRRVAMVFQQPVALEGTVADNLRAADLGLDDDAISSALGRVGLDPELAGRDARDLSGGERQRLGLARSLATGPEVLLLDEATSALDPANATRVEQLVAGFEEDGIVPVWVTHDLDQMARVARHVIVLIDGRVAQQGTVTDVLAAPTDAVARFLRGDET